MQLTANCIYISLFSQINSFPFALCFQTLWYESVRNMEKEQMPVRESAIHTWLLHDRVFAICRMPFLGKKKKKKLLISSGFPAVLQSSVLFIVHLQQWRFCPLTLFTLKIVVFFKLILLLSLIFSSLLSPCLKTFLWKGFFYKMNFDDILSQY